ncbi:hypothetical protein HUB98_09890 [Paenibacillus barcinonensis]|uniref:Uncharacterized protein n=1 Tax=Paenibacillus barcinonensis TaxID=198119 RepID=A0A2V4VWU6_PAEBA|nr:hypothetical protein [Paenibacillus barcinonensis]PYE49678.1 hypothetical protein DFQ00_105182 [Paenibacillus barcinonensis]QKS56618.1 hypothetical protein HUB98_09890 [Paenibacillus barcinonensis]
MERQLKKTFRSLSPKKKRFYASRTSSGFRGTKKISDSVMMIPPLPSSERALELEMKKIREGYIRDLGTTDYEKHITKVNQDFKSLMAKKGVRL